LGKTSIRLLKRAALIPVSLMQDIFTYL